MATQSWNQLHSWIFEASEAILEASRPEKRLKMVDMRAFRYHNLVFECAGFKAGTVNQYRLFFPTVLSIVVFLCISGRGNEYEFCHCLD